MCIKSHIYNAYFKQVDVVQNLKTRCLAALPGLQTAHYDRQTFSSTWQVTTPTL